MASPEGQALPDFDSLSFEDAFRQLSETAAQLEAGGLTLSEATVRFELGMKLVQRCNRLLDTAELEITRLKDSYQRGATPEASDFPEPDDDLPF